MTLAIAKALIEFKKDLENLLGKEISLRKRLVTRIVIVDMQEYLEDGFIWMRKSHIEVVEKFFNNSLTKTYN